MGEDETVADGVSVDAGLVQRRSAGQKAKHGGEEGECGEVHAERSGYCC